MDVLQALATSTHTLVISHPVTSAFVATGIGAVVLVTTANHVVISLRTSKAASHYDQLYDKPRQTAPASRTGKTKALIESGVRCGRQLHHQSHQHALQRVKVFRAAERERKREWAMLGDLESGEVGSCHIAIKEPLPQFVELARGCVVAVERSSPTLVVTKTSTESPATKTTEPPATKATAPPTKPSRGSSGGSDEHTKISLLSQVKGYSLADSLELARLRSATSPTLRAWRGQTLCGGAWRTASKVAAADGVRSEMRSGVRSTPKPVAGHVTVDASFTASASALATAQQHSPPAGDAKTVDTKPLRKTADSKPPRKKALSTRDANIFAGLVLTADGSETIPDQLRKALQKNHARVTDLFRQLDDDESGSVSRAEFIKAMGEFGMVADAEALAAVFRTFDTDDSGWIAYAELDRLLRKSFVKHPKLTSSPLAGSDGKTSAVASASDVHGDVGRCGDAR